MITKPHIRCIDGDWFCMTEYFGGAGSTPMMAYIGYLEDWGAPKHSSGCSNQNVLNPLGVYTGADICGCRGKPK